MPTVTSRHRLRKPEPLVRITTTRCRFETALRVLNLAIIDLESRPAGVRVRLHERDARHLLICAYGDLESELDWHRIRIYLCSLLSRLDAAAGSRYSGVDGAGCAVCLFVTADRVPRSVGQAIVDWCKSPKLAVPVRNRTILLKALPDSCLAKLIKANGL